MLNFKKEVRDIKRLQHISSVFLKNGFGYYVQKINSKEDIWPKKFSKKNEPEKDTEFPKKLVRSFEELGGAFIKLGQLLSLRPDIIPERYTNEFRKLQDNVTPFPFNSVKEIVENDLKNPLKNIFLNFDEKPLAAASIGQAHKATLKNKKKVIVKVQRPGIINKIESDIDIMFFLARLIEKHFHPNLIKPTLIIKEFEEYTKKELDYLNEAKNIDRVFKNTRDDGTRIPKVYFEHSSRRVLVMEYIEGTLLTNSLKISVSNKKIIAKTYLNAIYKEIFIDGFFHADPHPGNVIVVGKNNVSLIDFGICGYINPELKDKLVDLFSAIVEKDIDGITDSLLKIGCVKDYSNRDRLNQDLSENFSKYYNMELSKISLSEALRNVLDITKKNRVNMPASLILLAKCAITSESVVMELDPSFNPVVHAKPFVERLVMKRYSPKRLITDFKKNSLKFKNFIFRVPQLSEEMMDGLEKADRSIEKIHKDMHLLTSEMDKSSNRVSISLIITALLISSSFMMSFDRYTLFGFPLFSLFGFSLSILLGVMIVISVLKEKK
ncbi:MAG: hypothetical protein KKF44_10350 [Nanoarchaeota archaeon]|nr:hypothetical protein [Nanoarchaeota archaeon]